MTAYLGISVAILVITGIAIGAAWLVSGKKISLQLDRLFPRGGLARPYEPLLIQFDPAGISSQFTLGSFIWPFSWPSLIGRPVIRIIVDDSGRLVLGADENRFTFGPVEKRWNDPAKPQYQFVPEAGDTVSFTRAIGRFSWPTPFTVNWMGIPVPKRKRHIYDRLKWTKGTGSVLELTWRSEEWFYRRTGWAETYQNNLARISIRE